MTMAGIDNLIKAEDLTSEELRERARKGGKASVEARRKKKAMKEQFELLLSLGVKDKEARKKMKALGINPDNIDNQMATVISMWQESVKGNVQAATFIRDTIGEKPIEKVEMNASVNKVAQEIEEYVESREE